MVREKTGIGVLLGCTLGRDTLPARKLGYGGLLQRAGFIFDEHLAILEERISIPAYMRLKHQLLYRSMGADALDLWHRLKAAANLASSETGGIGRGAV